MKIGFIGTGSWATALAQVLCDNGHDVLLYGISQEEVNDINDNHQNSRFFKDVALSEKIKATDQMNDILDREVLLLGIPSKAMESVLLDLKQRLVIASQYPDALLVSIHCNKFPLESCKGLQVYYSGHTEAEEVAETVQESFLKIDPANHRQIKKADTSIYLLNRAKIPSILVECGFLSNKEELARLKTEDYRKMLALVVAGGILGGNINREIH